MERGLNLVSGWVSDVVSQLGGDLSFLSASAVRCRLTLQGELMLLPAVSSPKYKVHEGTFPGEIDVPFWRIGGMHTKTVISHT